MRNRTLSKVDLHVGLWGIAISLASIAFGDRSVFLGAFIGSVIAIANWLGFRWAGTRMAATANKGRFGVFLAFKMAAVLVVVYIVLVTDWVSPIAFVVGLSSLVLGVLSRSAFQALREGDAALKEEQ